MKSAGIALLAVIALLLGWSVWRQQTDRWRTADVVAQGQARGAAEEAALGGILLLKNELEIARLASAGVHKRIEDLTLEDFRRAERFGRYPATLSELATAQASVAIQKLTAGGYRLVYSVERTEDGKRGYQLQAIPAKGAGAGLRSFFVDQSGVVRQRYGRAAGPLDTPVR